MLCKSSQRGSCAQIPHVFSVLYTTYACLGTQGTHLLHAMLVLGSCSSLQQTVISGARSD